MNRRKGFSLTELLAVVVILGVLAGIAIPGFTKAKEKSAAKHAVTYLRAVRMGEKNYALKNDGTYLQCDNALSVTVCEDSVIKGSLGVEVPSSEYHFYVRAKVGSSKGSEYAVMALKNDTVKPTFENCTTTAEICLDQDGIWTGKSTYVDFTELNK